MQNRFSSIGGQLSLRSGKLLWLALFGVVVASGSLCGYVYFRAFVFPAAEFYPAFRHASWIRNPGRKVTQSFFRKDVYLGSQPENAWLCLSADSDYEIYVNDRKIGYDRHDDRNSLPFQAGQSEAAQRIGNEQQFHNQNYPELQWDATRDWKLGTFFSLNTLLRPGKNVIAIWAESERDMARIVVAGAIESPDGKELSLNSNTSWKVSPLEKYQDGIPWFQTNFDDTNWKYAESLGRPTENLQVVNDPDLYRSALQGSWLTGSLMDSSQLFFRKHFVLQKPTRQAWVRIATPQHYSLFINGSFIAEQTPANFVNMYNITPFLDEGDNVVAVYLRPPGPLLGPSPPLKFFLDGAVYQAMTRKPLRIKSDSSWKEVSFASRGWVRKDYDDSLWDNAVVLGGLSPQEAGTFGRRLLPYSSLGACYYSQLASYLVMGTVVFLVIWLLAAMWCRGSERSLSQSLRATFGGFIPALGLMLAVCLLQFRLVSSYWKILFYTRELWVGVLIASLCLTVLLLMLVRFPTLRLNGLAHRWKDNRFLHFAVGRIDRRSFELAGISILTVFGAFLRLWALGFQGYHSDEFASMEAALGIVKTGVPTYLTGIWYSRSPLYHYLLALFLKVLGNSPAVARLPAALFGIAIIPLSYKFCKDIFGKAGIGLLVAALIAFNPWIIFVSRNVRYYQQGQFLVLLTMYFFIRGFVQGNRRRDQVFAFVTFLAACLTSEVIVLLLPGFCISYLFLGQRFSFRERAWHFAGLVALSALVVVDVTTFTVLCLTPFVGIGETCRSVVALHFSNLPYFATFFFAGDGRLNVILTALFLFGIPLWILKRDRILLFLAGFLLIAVAVTTLFVMQIATRYSFHVYPLLIILAVMAANDIFSAAAELGPQSRRRRNVVLGWAACTFLAAAMFIGYEPGRIARSFNARINRSDSMALNYVRRHMRPHDVVVATQPQGAVVTLERGNQFFLSARVSFDEIYERDGAVVDRWGGGRLVDNVDQLRAVFAKSQRAWVVVSDVPFRLTIQPQLIEFLHENARAVFQVFYSNVFLWDRKEGTFISPKNNGRANNPY